MKLEKKWVLAKKAPQKFFQDFPEYNWVIAQLFFNRKIKNEARMENFIHPEFEDNLHNPFLLPNMSKAVTRIVSALKKKEKIMVYGDYDCDGITGAMIIYETLNYFGANKNLGFYLPDRDKEGYGISNKGAKKIIAEKYDLVITVDCGVANVKQITKLKKAGVAVIVTDHHTLQKQLPTAHAIVHAKLRGSKYPFADLSGAGIAFKVSQALLLGQNYPKAKSKTARLTFLKWLLDLAAIGTVADCVDLVNENRVIVKYGLIVLNKTKRLGLNALFQEAGINKGELSAYSIGFQIGPRLNSAGRMDHANTAWFLLMAKDPKKAKEFAKKLEKQNSQRQRQVDKIVKDAIEKLKNKSEYLLIAKDKNWPIGVAGLAASRVLSKLTKPTLICQDTGDIIKCSARSIDKFNIIKAITDCSSYLDNFGGHAAAAGLALKKENWPKFKKKIKKIAKDKLTKDDLVTTLKLDAKLEPLEISWDLIEQLSDLAPFGMANPKPKFWIQGLTVTDSRLIGQGNKHLKLKLSHQDLDFDIEAIGFSLADLKPKIGEQVDLAGNLEFNEWRGRKKIQINIIDIKSGLESK